ncbi:hypothetical protein PanWU01x14_146900 [Parasponia andersonii]|uniref:DUF642 domain-containing protein n=1 Tax=Parasponia andersonii TaxID=3476 RepID=A0A2P5CJS9_PARAD|nr:hypothetical protein PanWU01x14_146900 [Parasponia andersonii]
MPLYENATPSPGSSPSSRIGISICRSSAESGLRISTIKSAKRLKVPWGEDGRINQTFVANAEYLPIMGRRLGRAMIITWEAGVTESPFNLVIQIQTAESNSSSMCWPVIDKLLVKSMPRLVQENENLLLNGGFEYGPEFLNNSTEGILLDPAPSHVRSPLQEWQCCNRACVYWHTTAASLTEGSTYSLEFKLGDANNSCAKNFLVAAQAGSTAQNFTLLSNGTGSAKNFSLKFKADSSVTPISFRSYTTSLTKDGVSCGPVVDDVVLRVSRGMKPDMQWIFLVFLYLAAIPW